MAEHYSFFDAVLQDDGTYDREYNAQQFTKYFGALVTTGVMKGAGNMLAVSANGSNMVTKIDTGIAFVEAKYYENDSFKELTHDTETLGNSRIDRIVIRMDLSTEARYVKAFIKKGVPATNPVAPTLTQTPNLYEISLAQVKVVGGQTFIAADAVTDERGKDIICPWAGSNILPNFNDEGLQELIDSQLTDGKNLKDLTNPSKNIDEIFDTGFYWGSTQLGTTGTLPATGGAWIIHVFNIGANLSTGGTTVQIGYQTTKSLGGIKGSFQRNYNPSTGAWSPWTSIVELNNTLTSTSTTEAATANAVKQVNDKLIPSSWVDLTPLSGWSGRLRYRTMGNIVQVSGVAIKASAGYSVLIAQLPTEAMPPESIFFDAAANSSTAEVAIQLKMLSNGYISLFPSNNTNLTTYTNGIYFSLTFIK